VSGRRRGVWAMKLDPRWLPFADASSEGLPWSKLSRLGALQASVGMAVALLVGTINRVMIVEFSIAAALVGALAATPMLLAPMRAAIGHWSDQHRSAFGWRRVPYLWFGTLAQFGGLALMPFGLLLLAEGSGSLDRVAGIIGAGLAFTLVGLGAHTVQTAGLALATDLSDETQRPRVVAYLYCSLLLGMVVSGLVFAVLLADYTPLALIKVIQGAAVVTVLVNIVGMWKQEPMSRPEAADSGDIPFSEAWRRLKSTRSARRLLLGVGLGATGFGMQDVLLEPYGGEVMGLAVGATSILTALTAGGAVLAMGVAASERWRRADPNRLAASGAIIGAFALFVIMIAAPADAPRLLHGGSLLLGFGGGLFAVGTIAACMELPGGAQSGLVLGAWGAVYATSAGVAIGIGGLVRDLFTGPAGSVFGPGLSGPMAGYAVVYQVEILALFLAAATLGPLVQARGERTNDSLRPFGLGQMPG
jgi:BCD family chlorophyll transporter-like MFS transporter